MDNIVYRFEDIPSYIDHEWQAAPVVGEAEIEFDAAYDWWITRIDIEQDNGLRGKDLRTRMVRVYSNNPMHRHLMTALETLCREQIEDQIRERIESYADEYLAAE